MLYQHWRPILAILLLLAALIRPELASPAPVKAAEGQAFELLGSFGGQLGDLIVHNQVAYVAEGQGLLVYDLSDRQRPLRRARLQLDGLVTQVRRDANRLYLLVARERVQIVDISSAYAPVSLGSYLIPDTALAIDAAGGLLYTMSAAPGSSDRAPLLLQVVDPSDPRRPLVRSALTFDTYYGRDYEYLLRVVDGRGYWLGSNTGIDVFDLRDPASPTRLSAIPFHATFITSVMDFQVRGRFLYAGAANKVGSRGDSWPSFWIVDLADLNNPLMRSYEQLGGAQVHIQPDGRTAYTLSNGLLQALDVSDPAAPRILTHIQIFLGASKLAVGDGLALAANQWWESRIGIFEIDAASRFSALAEIALPGPVSQLQISGNLAYLNGLEGVVDISDPARPVALLPPAARVRQLFVLEGLRGYVALQNALQIFDLSSPSSPRLLGSMPLETWADDLAVSGGLLYLLDIYSFQIIDLANPAQPRLLSRLPASGYNSTLLVHGGFAYITNNDIGGSPDDHIWETTLEVLDVSNPAAPRLINSVYSESQDGRLYLHGTRLYLPTNESITIFDASDPANLRLLGYEDARPSDGGGGNTTGSGDLVYIARGGSLQALDLADPLYNGLVARYDMLKAIKHIQLVGDLLYLAGGDDGLVILRVHPERFQPLARSLCFPETMRCIGEELRPFWQQNGGLPVFGYPIADDGYAQNRDSQGVSLTQWFERARLELHPENQPPYQVLLGRLGDDLLRLRGIDWRKLPRAAGPQDGCLWFKETLHNLCDQGAGAGFKRYWQSHGLEFDGKPGFSYAESLALFGLPLSEPTLETNRSGDTVLTQWFERARFEWHPDNPDQYKVLLGLLGNELQGR